MFILSYEAGFYKPTVLKVPPPISRITAHATFHYLFLLQAFDPNEWCLRNGFLSGWFEPMTSWS